MSDDSHPPSTPAPAPVPAPGSTPVPPPATTPSIPPAVSPSNPPMGSRPPGPPIDILMPTPKKPFTIPPYAGCFVKMIFGFAVLLVMGYCALVALNPKARAWALQGAKDGSGGPTPFNALNQILAIPAQAVARKDAKPLSDPFGSSAAAGPGQSAARAAGAAEDNAGADLEGKISREAL